MGRGDGQLDRRTHRAPLDSIGHRALWAQKVFQNIVPPEFSNQWDSVPTKTLCQPYDHTLSTAVAAKFIPRQLTNFVEDTIAQFPNGGWFFGFAARTGWHVTKRVLQRFLFWVVQNWDPRWMRIKDRYSLHVPSIFHTPTYQDRSRTLILFIFRFYGTQMTITTFPLKRKNLLTPVEKK